MRTAGWTVWLVALGGVVVAACTTHSAAPEVPRQDAAPAAAPSTPTMLPGAHVAGVEFRAYQGVRAGDARLSALRDRLAAVVEPVLAMAEDRAGVTFLPGRDAAVDLADDHAGAAGAVTVRVLGGVRRPVIRIPVDALLAGTFLPEVHFPPLLVEAAVVASAGERTPPPWLRAGLGVELTGAFDRLLHERVLGGAAVHTAASALFPPTPTDDDPLRAAARVRALDRIARGDRPLARFVVARIEGRAEADALALVGVQDEIFLDAAAETERDSATTDVQTTGVEMLASVRDALRAGEPARAVAPAALLESAVREGRLGDWVAADARCTLATFLIEQGDTEGAAKFAAAALADPTHLVRVREARLAQARAAVAAGAVREGAAFFRAYVTDFPGAPGSDEALLALGVPPEVAAAVPGIAAEITSDDAAVRQRAAVRLGETGDPVVAAPLRELTGDDDADVRRLALAALALVVGDEAVPDLESGTRDSSPAVRGAALSLLAFAAPERGEARAKDLAADTAPEVKRVVERILAPLREAEARRVAQAEAARKEAERAAAEAERERLRKAGEEARQKAAEAAAARAKAAAAEVPPPPVRPVVVPPPPPLPMQRTDPPVKTPDPVPDRPLPPKPPARADDPSPSPAPVQPPKPPSPLPPPKPDDVPDTHRKPPPPRPPVRSDDADDGRRKPPPPPTRDPAKDSDGS